MALSLWVKMKEESGEQAGLAYHDVAPTTGLLRLSALFQNE